MQERSGRIANVCHQEQAWRASKIKTSFTNEEFPTPNISRNCGIK